MQNDLLQLLQPLGVVTKIVMLRAKNQVLKFDCFLFSELVSLNHIKNVFFKIKFRVTKMGIS